MDPVTEDDLTPGPWVWRGLDRSQAVLDGSGGQPTQQVICLDLPDHYNPADLQFIAAARTVVPELLAQLRAAQAEKAAARAAAKDNPLMRELLDLITLMPDTQTQEIIDYILSLRDIRYRRDHQ